jgi:two-component system chemotaxis response regulator CheV
MPSFVRSVDHRTRLAGTNRLEVLLFTLGDAAENARPELFGINVFKVREIMYPPEITRAPDMPVAVEGIVNIRGVVIPVIDLATFCSIQARGKPKLLIVTEYNNNVQAFLVRSVVNLERLDWGNVKAPPPMLTNHMGGLVTAVAELPDGRLVMLMDVEKVLADTAGLYDDNALYEGIDSRANGEATVVFADDSSVARGQIASTLDRMGFKHVGARNGAEAWRKLTELAEREALTGRAVEDEVRLIITDVEMPEMDGYVFTRKVKEDPRFGKIPVIMHSSLSARANEELGMSVGADAYVSKFRPRDLAATIEAILAGQV